MVWAILVTIFCFLPFGIPAIVYAGKVNALWDNGNYDAAREAARKARMWSIIAALVGFGLYIICTLCMSFFGWGVWGPGYCM